MKIKKGLCVLAIPPLLFTSCSGKTADETETFYTDTDKADYAATGEAVRPAEETALSETASEIVITAEAVEDTEITSEEKTEAEVLSVCKCKSEWQHAYSEYLNGLDGIFGGVYLGDINGDEIPEAVIEINAYELTYILYYNESGMQLLPLETVSQWGDVTYISDTKQILFTPMYGHTQGTWAYVECYLYGWDGSDYTEDISLYRTGYVYYDSDGELHVDLDDSLINGEAVENDVFEAENNRLSALAEGNSYFPIVSVSDENFEKYVKENFPCFNNWDIIYIPEWQ